MNKDWAPLDSQTGFGFDADFAQAGWPVNIVVGYITTSDKMSIVELETTELGFGIRKYIDSGNQLKLFVDGGFLKADVTLSVSGSGSASDDGTGFWLGGGVDYMVTDAVSVGVNARFSSADDSDGFDIGGTHFGFSVGYHLK